MDMLSQGELTVLISVMALLVSVVGYVTSRRSLHRASCRTAADLVLAADQMMVERPALRPYLYGDDDGKPVPVTATGEERWRIEAAGEFFLDVFETIWDHRPEYTPHDRDSWREWIHEIMESSPVIQGIYTDGGARWYPTLAGMFADEVCDSPDDHVWVNDQVGKSQISAVTRWWRGMRRQIRAAVPRLRVAGRSAGEPSRS